MGDTFSAESVKDSWGRTSRTSGASRMLASGTLRQGRFLWRIKDAYVRDAVYGASRMRASGTLWIAHCVRDV
jgi:hypothetical protein